MDGDEWAQQQVDGSEAQVVLRTGSAGEGGDIQGLQGGCSSFFLQRQASHDSNHVAATLSGRLPPAAAW
ncbi:hypothetical protein [Dictyobacter alpinus]|uniref:hypothetical protein n=1 Tax=Dictyobacter alpinus TaxID=2014873 RepID=UPI000F833388|nr:hypothetical protein [Dictyobacter alpinus]